MSSQDQDRRRIKERLAAVGVTYSDIYSLKRNKDVLNRAAPILLELLPTIKSPQVKGDLIRVASDASIDPKILVLELNGLRANLEKVRKPASNLAQLKGDEFIAELARIRAASAATSGAASIGWTLAEALRLRADETVYDDLVEIIRDKRYGRARQMLPFALVNVKSRRAETIGTLIDSLGDEDITPHAIDALSKLKAVEAIPSIEAFLESKVPLERSEAKKALKALEKAKTGKKPDEPKSPPEPLPPIPDDSVEASCNFDLEDVAPLLERLVTILDDVGDLDIRQLETRISEMEPDEEEDFRFTVAYRGDETLLAVRVYMSDVDAPDIAFFSSPELARSIDDILDEFIR